MNWIDTHCHLDAAEFSGQRSAVRARARAAGVVHCVIPAVSVDNFGAVRELAHREHDSYCLGIHPLYVPSATEADLATLDATLATHLCDPRLVAVGEIGLDFFVPELCATVMREKQEYFYQAQLKLARKHGLPVVLHVRRSADRLLKHLRALQPPGALWSGIAHAFNGSEVQARAFVGLGFKLGFGGAVTFERALQLRSLAQTLPLDSLVLETDAPDIPPHWLYVTAQARAQGTQRVNNEPGELPRIGALLAQFRGLTSQAMAQATMTNACAALPRLRALLV